MNSDPAVVEAASALDPLLDGLWSQLENAVTNRRHAFHTPALSTVHELSVASRIVVLRAASRHTRQIICHTDVRSDKVTQILHNPHVSWLFYDPAAKVQVRAEGLALIHQQDDIAEFSWLRTPPTSRRCYLTMLPPGSSLGEPGTNLPSHLHDRAPDAAESEEGWKNFCVVVSTITHLEWLYLDAHGHQRAGWDWENSTWHGAWLVP
jgi:pyridoxine/pyridoxamine 5'-phosphate oxidase